ncbi:hypothetical protein [Salinigranum marinum]|nr:hypothetical protein [Salinigranum marinum]
MNGPDGTRSRRVSAVESSPGRLVFTEEGNRDGWIASDTTVSLDASR